VTTATRNRWTDKGVFVWAGEIAYSCAEPAPSRRSPSNMTYSPLDPAPKRPISVHVSSLLVGFLSIVVIEAPKIAWSKSANSSTDRCSNVLLPPAVLQYHQQALQLSKELHKPQRHLFIPTNLCQTLSILLRPCNNLRFRISRSSSQYNSTP